MAAEHGPSSAVKPIHKRVEHWKGHPFRTLEEVAGFVSALTGTLEEQGVQAPLAIRIATEDREYRDLKTDDLPELSLVLPMESITTLCVQSPSSQAEPIMLSLLVMETEGGQSLDVEVEGTNEVAVDGSLVWIAKAINGQFDRLRKARELAEAKSRPSRDEGESVPTWHRWLNHPWAIQIGGGAIATVVATVLIILLTH